MIINDFKSSYLHTYIKRKFFDVQKVIQMTFQEKLYKMLKKI